MQSVEKRYLLLSVGGVDLRRQPQHNMNIQTTKNQIASVNFHGASFSDAEWEYSKTADGSDLDTYSGAAIVTANKGDFDSCEWFVVAGAELISVADCNAASEAFMFAAKIRCDANRAVANPLGAGAAEVDSIVAVAVKNFLN